MHTDARTLDDGAVIEGDICIVGGGAAGISMALEWIGAGHKVILLEGGGFDYDPDMQALYDGKSIGDPYQVPLSAARLHYFGGTTNHWAGWSAPMEPLNFQKRDWVPYSGWPFSKEELDPYYERAHVPLELGPYEYDAAFYEKQEASRKQMPFKEELMWTKMWQFSPPTRFGVKYRDTIVNSDNVHLFTYANVTEIVANETVKTVEKVKAQTLTGKTHWVHAKHFVLACGTIQNARVLLASNNQAPAGLGNDNDLVGRFFMEHLEMGGAQLVLKEPDAMPLYGSRFGGSLAPCGEIALSEKAQKDHQILNSTASLRPGRYSEDMTSFFQMFSEYSERFRSRPLNENPNRAVRSDAFEAHQFYRLPTRAEQAPNPDSRVVLSAEKDALGMPFADLHWKLTELDQRSVRVFFEILGKEIGRMGFGRIQLLDWLIDGDDSEWPSFLSGGFHHMGTTRMHEDPRQGVLDADAKVHGIDNLYVASASAFTTSGAPNPTLTLVALSLRLSDHLKGKMS